MDSYRNAHSIALEKKKELEQKEKRLRKERVKKNNELAWLRGQRFDNGERLLAIVKQQGGFVLLAPQFRDYADNKGNVDMTALLAARKLWIEDCKDLIDAAKRNDVFFRWNKDWNLTNQLAVYNPAAIRRA